ncbi:unnamed protein product [Mytilus edulis]|uniref:C-type lectin domain-containing protein n=1 Tax=Mytilus edulis TaxID=6550 RepID=A0A8S3PLV1_MYTED|nr:unnamed protein product [Mytilus edulis]
MGICETFLTSNTEDSFISIKGFELERKDRCETNKIPAGVRFTIPFIKLDETKKLLSKLETSKATGLDEVGPFFIKLSSEALAPSITYLINLSILEGVFPENLKLAKVTPIFKNGIVDCPSEWIRFGNSCYLYENTRKLDWDNTMEYCVSQGGYLAEVTDEAEFQLVNSIITASVFLGCRNYNGKWKWTTSDKELLLNDTLWTPGEPAEGSKCLQIWKGKQFDDIWCEHLKPVLCEKVSEFIFE